jgi:hypothetical protein
MRCALDWFRGEHDRVMNLADNPFLNSIDKLGCRDFGSTPINEPGVGEAGYESY